MVIQKR